MTSNRSSRALAICRTLCVAVVACTAWLALTSDATAGVILATEAAVSEMSAPQAPAVPEPATPFAPDGQLRSLLHGDANNATGAGSTAPTFGPSTGLVALLFDGPSTAETTLIS